MTPAVEPRFLDVGAAAVYLGRTEQSLYSLCARQQIPHYRQRSRIFFRVDELEAWMAEFRIETSTR